MWASLLGGRAHVKLFVGSEERKWAAASATTKGFGSALARTLSRWRALEADPLPETREIEREARLRFGLEPGAPLVWGFRGTEGTARDSLMREAVTRIESSRLGAEARVKWRDRPDPPVERTFLPVCRRW